MAIKKKSLSWLQKFYSEPSKFGPEKNPTKNHNRKSSKVKRLLTKKSRKMNRS